MMRSGIGVKSFCIFVLCCAACSESPTDTSDTNVGNQSLADTRAQLDRILEEFQVVARTRVGFEKEDSNGDGVILPDEISPIGTVYDALTGERYEGEAIVQYMMDRFDTNRDGKLEYPEMVSTLVRELLEQQEAEQ